MKKKYPIIYLFEIPVEIFLYAIVMGLAARLDAYVIGGGATLDNGKTAYPYFTMVILVIATILLIGAIAASIVNFVRYSIKKQQKRKAAKAAMEKDAERRSHLAK